MFVDFHILNELGSPSINSNTFANRPPAGQIGRLFVSTDTFEIYRDNGTTWDLIGGPGSSTVTGTGAATQVAFWTAAQAIGGSNNLWWDNTNGYLGVKTNAPTAGVNVVQTDGQAILSEFTTVAGSGNNAVAIYGRNTTNSSGYVAVLEEKTPNSASGQYPIKIMHSLSSGTAAANMATGIHFSLPDNAGTERINQLSMDTVDPAAATYSSRYRFVLRQNGSAATPFYITGTGIGVFTGTPTSALDVHSTGVIAQLNSTGTTNNSYLAFQRNGSGVWRLGDNYNGGNNQFEIHNTVLTVDAVTINAATNKTSWQAQETYTTGQARGNYFDYNLSVSAGGSFSSPNAISALGATLDLTLAGNATIPSGARSGLDAYNTISFTGSGTLTHNQGSKLRAYSNVTAGWAFAGSATGTITHLAGMRVLFPDNSGSAVTITNNYGLLINDQTANTGTVTYTNRWGIYQEGASDLNYMAANLLLGSTVNSGEKLQVTGTAKVTGAVTVNGSNITIDPSTTTTYALFIAQNAGGYTRIGRDTSTGALYGDPYASLLVANGVYPLIIGTNDTERVRVTAAGLVGINTNAPTQTLDVNGGLAVTGTTPLSLQRPVIPTFDGQGAPAITWQFYSTGTTYTVGASIQGLADAAWSSTSAPTSIRFYTVPSGSVSLAERMRITNGGNVGIGTNAPTTYGLLGTHIDVFGGSAYAFYHSTTNTVKSFYGARESQADVRLFAVSNHPIAFGTNDTERARVTAGGNFLIGSTTDTGEKLQVTGAIVSTSYFAFNNNTGEFFASGTTSSNTIGGSPRFKIYDLNNTKAWSLQQNANYELQFWHYNGSSWDTISKFTSGGAIVTKPPSGGTSGQWKLGSRVAATVILDTTQYIEVDIGGTLYKLAIVN